MMDISIYIESTESVEDMMEQADSDDERKPLLDRREVRDIVDQVSRLRQEEQDLLAESESLTAKADVFKKVPKKRPFWRKVCCCCCPKDETDDT